MCSSKDADVTSRRYKVVLGGDRAAFVDLWWLIKDSRRLDLFGATEIGISCRVSYILDVANDTEIHRHVA